MKKQLFTALAVIGLLVGSAFAAGPDPETETLGGTIPFLAEWTFTATDQTGKLTPVDAADYEANLIEVTGFQVCTDLDANDSLKISAKVGTWTKPADYPDLGNKNTVTETSDFKIKVAANDTKLAIEGAFAGYTLLTSSDQSILISHTLTEPPSGIEDQDFTIDAEVLLDWVNDVPGIYAITMTLTLSQL